MGYLGVSSCARASSSGCQLSLWYSTEETLAAGDTESDQHLRRAGWRVEPLCGPGSARLANEFLARHHYLGSRGMAGRMFGLFTSTPSGASHQRPELLGVANFAPCSNPRTASGMQLLWLRTRSSGQNYSVISRSPKTNTSPAIQKQPEHRYGVFLGRRYYDYALATRRRYLRPQILAAEAPWYASERRWPRGVGYNWPRRPVSWGRGNYPFTAASAPLQRAA